jgi:hypothetical protein
MGMRWSRRPPSVFDLRIGISTPYSRTGLLHDKFKKCFGTDDADCLVVRGKSLDFNLTLNPKIVEKAFNADPEAASSEWLAEFRADITSFFDDKVIKAAVDPSRPLELPFRYGVAYHAFVDASGGRGDSYTACIGHRLDDGHFVCDVMLGQPPPFQPAEVTRWFAEVIRSYGIQRVTGDNYSAQWSRGRGKRRGSIMCCLTCQRRSFMLRRSRSSTAARSRSRITSGL